MQSTSETGAKTPETTARETPITGAPVTPGAGVLEAKGFSEFSEWRVGLIASRASVVGDRSVIDIIAESRSVELVAIFAPEHGIRAEAGAGVEVSDAVDPVTGLPVHSLYGSTRRPTPETLVGLDALLFDLQDVGTRFYTYTSTMGLAMQAAAEAGIPFVVLDRPNPLGGSATGGSMRDDHHESFISQYPIPSVHGMTVGELALAIKGERWLDGLESLDLRVSPIEGWSRNDLWADTGLAWVPPSPGLPTPAAAQVYPATVLFEGTSLSYGRGTDFPFQQIGAPWLDGEALAAAMTEKRLPGVSFVSVVYTPTTNPQNGPPAIEPQFDGQEVFGVRIEVRDAAAVDPTALGIHLLAEVLGQAQQLATPIEVIDRPDFFDLLTGSTATRTALLAGQPAEQIVDSWAEDLARFESIRKKYLLY